MAVTRVADQLSLDDLLDVIGVLVVVLDAEGRIVRFNAACERTTGYREDEVVGTKVWEFLLVEEEADAVKAVFQDLRARAAPNQHINDWITKNGGRRRIAWSNTISIGSDDQVEYVIGTGTDITDRLATESALRNNRTLLQTIITTSPDAIITIDVHGHIESSNTAAQKMFGYAPSELIGKNVNMLMPEPYRNEHDGYIEHYLRTGEKRIIGLGREVVGKRKDGTTFPIELAVGEVNLDGQRRFTGFIRDITKRRQAEEERAQSDRRLAAALESLPLGVILCDPTGRITHVNREMKRHMYWQGDALRPGASYEDLIRDKVEMGVLALPEGDREQWLEKRLEQIRLGEPTRLEMSRTDGSWAMAIEQRTPEGELIALRLDITAQKKAEEDLRASMQRLQELQAEFTHVSRLSAMGEMAATLAHELNQPLTAVMNYVQAARKVMSRAHDDGGSKVDEMLSKTAEQAHRAGDIIRHLRNFVARGESEKMPEDMNDVVADACALALVGARAEGIDVHMQLDEDLPPILMDRIQIQQVVVNLVRNSVDALQDQEDRKVVITTARDGADGLRTSVADNGPGLAAEIEAQLFEPFVTSKEEGMGIGLAVSRTIVEGHGGVIRAEPNPGRGVIFSFTLPAA